MSARHCKLYQLASTIAEVFCQPFCVKSSRLCPSGQKRVCVVLLKKLLCMLQDAGVFTIVPAEVLRQNPLQHAVALMPLAEVAAAHRDGGVQLPEGAGRLVVRVDGTESDEDLACLKVCACSVLAVLPMRAASHP